MIKIFSELNPAFLMFGRGVILAKNNLVHRPKVFHKLIVFLSSSDNFSAVCRDNSLDWSSSKLEIKSSSFERILDKRNRFLTEDTFLVNELNIKKSVMNFTMTAYSHLKYPVIRSLKLKRVLTDLCLNKGLMNYVLTL